MSIKRLLAAISIVAGLAASQAAQSTFIYSLDAVDDDGLPDFVLTVSALIAGNPTDFELTDFDSITLPAAWPAVATVRFGNPTGAIANLATTVNFIFNGSSAGFFWTNENAFAGPGVYCAGFIGCNETDAIMTIREVGTAVPEPTTLALLGLGLAGLGFSRRWIH